MPATDPAEPTTTDAPSGATPAEPAPLPTAPLPTLGPCAIVSADRDPKITGAGVAIGASGVPPKGNVTLEPLTTPLLLNPGQLWVTVPIPPSTFQIVAYTTYGSGAPMVLAGTGIQKPVAVAPIDPTDPSQLWELVRDEGAAGFVFQNVGANGAALGRSDLMPVPGCQLELGSTVPGAVPYRYVCLPVPSPAS